MINFCWHCAPWPPGVSCSFAVAGVGTVLHLRQQRRTASGSGEEDEARRLREAAACVRAALRIQLSDGFALSSEKVQNQSDCSLQSAVVLFVVYG